MRRSLYGRFGGPGTETLRISRLSGTKCPVSREIAEEEAPGSPLLSGLRVPPADVFSS